MQRLRSNGDRLDLISKDTVNSFVFVWMGWVPVWYYGAAYLRARCLTDQPSPVKMVSRGVFSMKSVSRSIGKKSRLNVEIGAFFDVKKYIDLSLNEVIYVTWNSASALPFDIKRFTAITTDTFDWVSSIIT